MSGEDILALLHRLDLYLLHLGVPLLVKDFNQLVVAEMAELEDLLVVQVVVLVHNLLEMVQVHQVIMELKYQHLRV